MWDVSRFFHHSARLISLASGSTRWVLALPLLYPVSAAWPQTGSIALAPFAAPGTASLHPAWRFAGLPAEYGVPPTRLEPIATMNPPALQISTDRSYGSVVHAWAGPVPGQLEWRWRLDQALANADIATKAGDDSALKVCVLFDQPLADMPFLERNTLRLARAVTGEALPAATLCYLWDSRYPASTQGSNAHSRRVRHIVVQGPDAALGEWVTQRRDVLADFQRLFGTESSRTPPVIGIALGADSDNTLGHSRGAVAALRWTP